MKAAFRDFKEGVVTASRKRAARSLSEKNVLANAWMASFFQRVGNQMPHLQQVIILTNCVCTYLCSTYSNQFFAISKIQTHLPHFLTKRTVYQMMVEGLRQQGHETFISESNFYLMWEKGHKSVVIPKVRICIGYNLPPSWMI